MGKSGKKSNVEAPDTVSVPPVKSAKKGGKRDSDQVIAKSVSAKKHKVDAIIPKQSGKKSKKKSKKASIPEKKEPKTSGSEDITSSESEEEVRTPAKRTNKTVKAIEKEVSSSEESSDEDEDVKMDDPPSNATGKQAAKKSKKKGLQTPAGSQNEKPSDATGKQAAKKSKKKVDEDVKIDDPPSNATGKRAATKTLFVGNLPLDVSEVQVHVMEFFKEAGKIIDVRLSQNPDGSSKGFGHVEFADLAAAQKAIEMNGQELLGRALKLDFAREKGQTILVRGFDKSQKMDQSEISLKKYFGSCGEITRISLLKDHETGGSNGIAYMDFKDKEALTKALELNGTKLGDYALTVEEAKPRGDSRIGGGSSRRRGGGGGGGGRSGGRGGRGRGTFVAGGG